MLKNGKRNENLSVVFDPITRRGEMYDQQHFFSSSEKWDSDVLGAARLGSAQLISLSTETIYLHFVPPLPSAPVEIKRQFE